MNLRLLATALCIIAIPVPACAEVPDLASFARSSGMPEIPGLKMI